MVTVNYYLESSKLVVFVNGKVYRKDCTLDHYKEIEEAYAAYESHKITKQEFLEVCHIFPEGASQKEDVVKKAGFLIKEEEGKKRVYLEGYEDNPIPQILGQEVFSYLEAGLNVNFLKNFWKRCLKNPYVKDGNNPIEGLFKFIKYNGLVINQEGFVIGKKKVEFPKQSDYEFTRSIKDLVNYYYRDGKIIPLAKWSFNKEEKAKFEKLMGSAEFISSYQKSRNIPEEQLVKYKLNRWTRLPAHECSYDPTVSCGPGLHIGSDSYVKTFGTFEGVVIACLFDPAEVTSIPYNEEDCKIRVAALYPFAIVSSDPFSDKVVDIDYEEYEEYCEECGEPIDPDFDDYLCQECSISS